MSCTESSRVQAFYDGEMPAREMAALATHFETCAACRENLAELRQMTRLLAGAPLPEIPAGMAQRLERTWSSARDRGVMRIAGWMTAAAAAVLVGALWLWPHDSVENSTPWQSAAVMPPAELRDEPAPELVAAAQWIASDLSVTEGVNR